MSKNEIVSITFSDGATWRIKGPLAGILRAKYDKAIASKKRADDICGKLGEIEDLLTGGKAKSPWRK